MPRRDDDYDDDDDREIRSRHRRARRRYEDEDEDEYEDRDEDDEDYEEPSSGGKLIPYKNGLALGAYYVSFLSIILVLAGMAMGFAILVEMFPKGLTPLAIGVDVLGILVGPIAAILGILGIRYARRHPRAKGGGHALAGIFIGVAATLIGLLLLVGYAVFAFAK